MTNDSTETKATWPQRFGLPAEDPEITKMRKHSTIIWRDAQGEWPQNGTWVLVITKENCHAIKIKYHHDDSDNVHYVINGHITIGKVGFHGAWKLAVHSPQPHAILQVNGGDPIQRNDIMYWSYLEGILEGY
jgi:hypothetical protein